jgi:hypothetical protein
VPRRLECCAYDRRSGRTGGPPRARRGTAAWPARLEVPRAERASGRVDLGQHMPRAEGTSGRRVGARPPRFGRRRPATRGARARDVAAWWRSAINCVAGTDFKLYFLQNFE